MKGSTPVFRQGKEPGRQDVWQRHPRRTGKEIHEEIKSPSAGTAFINAYHRCGLGPPDKFFPARSEAVKDNKGPGFCVQGLRIQDGEGFLTGIRKTKDVTGERPIFKPWNVEIGFPS
jgi:hypothetical protein